MMAPIEVRAPKDGSYKTAFVPDQALRVLKKEIPIAS